HGLIHRFGHFGAGADIVLHPYFHKVYPHLVVSLQGCYGFFRAFTGNHFSGDIQSCSMRWNGIIYSAERYGFRLIAPKANNGGHPIAGIKREVLLQGGCTIMTAFYSDHFPHMSMAIDNTGHDEFSGNIMGSGIFGNSHFFRISYRGDAAIPEEQYGIFNRSRSAAVDQVSADEGGIRRGVCRWGMAG